MRLSERVRRRREQLRQTQAEAANAAGISLDLLGRIERLDYVPRQQTAMRRLEAWLSDSDARPRRGRSMREIAAMLRALADELDPPGDTADDIVLIPRSAAGTT